MEMGAFKFNMSLFDDLIDKCSKLESLGSAVADLTWADSQGITDYMSTSGQMLGLIIVDYAEMIRDGVGRAQGKHLDVIRGHKEQNEQVVSPEERKAHAAVQAA